MTTTKMVAIANVQRIHSHSESGIVEDGLGVVEGHQGVVLEVSGISRAGLRLITGNAIEQQTDSWAPLHPGRDMRGRWKRD